MPYYQLYSMVTHSQGDPEHDLGLLALAELMGAKSALATLLIEFEEEMSRTLKSAILSMIAELEDHIERIENDTDALSILLSLVADSYKTSRQKKAQEKPAEAKQGSPGS